MRYFILIPLLCFQYLAGCQNDDKLKALENENRILRGELEGVKDELRACREGQPIFSEDFFLEGLAGWADREGLDFEDLSKVVKVVVKSMNGTESVAAQKIDSMSNDMLGKIEQLRIKLVQSLCGEGCVELQKKHYQDKATATRVMLDEGEAEKLRKELESLVQFYVGFQIQPENLKTYKPLHPILSNGESWETTGKTWEEFKFRGMPPAAIFPILSQMKVDIRHDELTVLETLKK
ncbi:MAG: hypothetical protein IT258_11325 [Saprospiraceae bacterium]|nr:hypothetical protein [Saprospiraceae bacterium]